MKKRMALVLLILTLLVTSACGTTPAGSVSTGQENADAVAQAASQPAEEGDDEFILGFDVGNSIYPYCVLFGDTVKEYGAANGITVLYSDCQGDVAVQNNNMENFIVQGADVISGIYQDKDGTLPSLELAKENGIPIVSCCQFLTDADELYDEYIYCGSINYDGGYIMGEWMAENLPEDAGIWYCYSHAGDAQCEARFNGMVDALADAGRDDVEVVSRMDTHGVRDEGVTVMEDWMQSYDKIDCVAGANDDPVLGALEAAKAAGRAGETIFVGLDASAPALDAIEAGEMKMSVFQDAVGQAKALIDVCVRIRDGEDPAQIEDQNVPYAAVTIDNLADYR